MENASKALIIAGGILIGIVILSIGVYLISSASGLANSYDEKQRVDEINSYNNKFLVYKNGITAQEMVSLYNLVTETNEKNSADSSKKINLLVNNKNIIIDKDYMVNIMSKEDGNDETFKCISVKFNDEGYINEMNYTSTITF